MRNEAKLNLAFAASIAALWLAQPAHAQMAPLVAPLPGKDLPRAAAGKPPVNTKAATGPGTQTEDDVYVGTKRQVQGVNTPGTTPQVRPSAGTSPNTGAAAARKTARSGGDNDLDDLEVERRKVQGVNTPGTVKPLPRPGAGTSPNTGRSAAEPAVLPKKP
jgi:hypothetical protein